MQRSYIKALRERKSFFKIEILHFGCVRVHETIFFQFAVPQTFRIFIRLPLARVVRFIREIKTRKENKLNSFTMLLFSNEIFEKLF